MKKEDVAVSIHMLSYNHEKYLRESLDGLVSQKTRFKFEIVIHDDASQDRSPEIIKEYAEKYPELFIPILQKENQYSKGILGSKYIYPRCRGKYIAYCEGDDYWCDPYKLQKQFDILERHSDCSICVHQVATMDESGTLDGGYIPLDGRGAYSGIVSANEVMRYNCLYQLSSYFVRRSALQEYIEGSLEFTKILTTGDERILKSVAMKGDFYALSDVMSCYRKGVSESWTSRLRKLEDSKILEYYLKSFQGQLCFDKETNYRFQESLAATILEWPLKMSVVDPRFAKEVIKSSQKDLDRLLKFAPANVTKWYAMMKFYPGIYKRYSFFKQLKS